MREALMIENPSRYQEDINQTSSSFKTRGGETVTMRLIRPEDAELLIDLTRRLSPESRRQRFHQSVDHLSDMAIQAFAKQLADVDNYTLGGAILALTADPDGTPHAVGVARLGRMPDKPNDPTADAAIVIRDDYQGQGVGTELLRRLVLLAKQMEVKQMTALIEGDNKQAIHLFSELELPTKIDISYGEVTMLIDIPE